MVITVRDGKMFHSVDYLSHAEALEAVGCGSRRVVSLAVSGQVRLHADLTTLAKLSCALV